MQPDVALERERRRERRRTARWAGKGLAYLPPVLALVSGLILWEAAVRLFDVPRYLLPPPSEIIAAARSDAGALLGVHSRVTLMVAAAGLGCSVAAGVILGALIHRVQWLRQTLYPLLVISQTIPVIVLVPLLVVWFGYGLTPKLIIVAIVCFFPVAVAVVDGLDRADGRLVKLVRSMGASPGQIFWKVNVPSAAPSLFTGLRVAATYTVMAAVVSEWMGADQGLGVYIARSARSFRIDRVFAGVVLVSLYSVIAFWLVDALRKKALPWERLLSDHTNGRGEAGTRK